MPLLLLIDVVAVTGTLVAVEFCALGLLLAILVETLAVVVEEGPSLPDDCWPMIWQTSFV